MSDTQVQYLGSIVVVHHQDLVGRVYVVSPSPQPCRTHELFAIENERCVGIIRSFTLRVALAERQPGTPHSVGQLRFGQVAGAFCVFDSYQARGLVEGD